MSRLLDHIVTPADLRRLPTRMLPDLAKEIRERIVQVVSQNQGHLASNLGVVELAIALHYCFDFHRDRLVWDVGHQCYAHKILTGRNLRFPSLRQKGGLTGFPCRGESPFDPFTTGHAGASVSTALGLACAFESLGRDDRVVAVLGDGAAATGMAFEALNHAGALKKNLLVILNDNQMSISRTVGAFSEYLSRVRAAPLYGGLKREVHQMLQRIPVLGRRMEGRIEHLKEIIKRSMSPGQIFEELGFNYLGPIDGHNLARLVDILRAVKQMEGPVLLHVVTTKGKGFDPAAEDPARFHSAKRFEYQNGSLRVERDGCRAAFTDAFAAALIRAAEKDARIVAITAAMPDGTGLSRFRERFPDRYFDVGIAEQHALGLAAGLAAGGLKPVVAVYSTFLQRAFDQVFHELCLQNLPVVLAIDRGGLVGQDGPTHHGVFDIACLRSLPNLTLMSPKDAPELDLMLQAALALPGPAAIRYPRACVPEPPLAEPCPPIEIGRAEWLRRGDSVAIFAYGAMAQTALEAADRLAEAGARAAVVNARFVKPLDRDAVLQAAAETGAVVTLEEHALAGGFGAAVLEALADAGAAARVLRLGVPDEFIGHGRRSELLADLGLDADGVAARVLEWLRAE